MSMQWIRFIKANMVAALVCAPMLSMAQFDISKEEMRRISQMPKVQPFLTQLRCEKVPPEQTGTPDEFLGALSSFVNSLVAALPAQPSGPKADPLELLSFEVWPGVQTKVQVIAEPGIFGVLQHYRNTDKNALLKALTASGWVFERVPSTAASAMKLVPVYQASQPVKNPNRTLTLMYAKLDARGGEPDLDGLTLMCRYGEKKK